MVLMLGAVAVAPATHAQALTPQAQPPAQAMPAAPSPGAAPPAAPTASTPPAPAPTGQVTIESDTQQADNVTGIITATGNVKIVYPDRRVVATSRQAQYLTREGMIVLSGDVEVVQDDGNLLRADRVTYLVDRERALAQPLAGQQVFSKLFIQTEPRIQGPTGLQPAPSPSRP